MDDASVWHRAQRERERLVRVEQQLRLRLASVDAELEETDTFLAMYERFAAAAHVTPPAVHEPEDEALPQESDEAPAEAGIEVHLVLGGGFERHVPVQSLPLLIGSDAECDLVFAGSEIRPQHASIWIAGNEVLVRACDPAAALTIDDRPVSFTRLEDGDLLTVGDVPIRISIREVPAA